MGDKFVECQKPHSQMGGKTDGCQEFRVVSSSSQLKSAVCGCDRNYHRKVVYSKCNKIHDLKNPNSVDGCQKFIAHLRDYSKCAACGCHRSFHGNEVVTTKEVTPVATPAPYYLD